MIINIIVKWVTYKDASMGNKYLLNGIWEYAKQWKWCFGDANEDCNQLWQREPEPDTPEYGMKQNKLSEFVHEKSA